MKEFIRDKLNNILKIIRLSILIIKVIDRKINLFSKKLNSETIDQVLLLQMYKDMLHQKKSLPKFDEIQFRNYSQNGEDGILLYIFSLIGVTNKIVVEICAGDGIECNSANLIINHGWKGLLFDGDKLNTRIAKAFYLSNRDTRIWPPKIIHAWITKSNINKLISTQGTEGAIDLLSIDMDGTDYWIWDSITCISPRVVVVEYNDIWGPKRAVTIPYQDDFKAQFTTLGPDYAGASLAAFVKLGKKLGYRLVGNERYGFNAFFVKNGIGEDLLPEIPISECFNHPKNAFGKKYRLPKIINRKWISV